MTFLAIHFLPQSEAITCPSDGFIFPSEDICVIPYTTPQFYVQADQQCRSLGGLVAKVGNAFENAYLSSMIIQDFNSKAPYIGVEKDSNGTWTYSDGSPLSYQNWAPGEPKSSNSSICAILDPSTAQWNATDCTVARPYFCTVTSDVPNCPNGWLYNEETDFCDYLQLSRYSSLATLQLDDSGSKLSTHECSFGFHPFKR